jgi:protein subunit release factor B
MSLHPAALPTDKLLAECEITRTRRSGPGGQHRNKTETAVIMRHKPSGISAEANERRSQEENRQVALFRLRVNMALSVRCPVSEDDRPSELWRSRCREGRVAVNSQHADFPALLAEALDTLASRRLDVKAAAERLGCTSSQLIKLLQQEPRALAQVNSARTEAGLHRLK